MSQKLKNTLLFFVKYWTPFIIWAVVIFSFSSNPTVSTSEIHWQDFVIKKSAHLFEYFVFSLLLYRALVNSEIKTKNLLLLIILVAFLYGTTDEFHQSFTPGREPKFRDVLIDTSGSILFFIYLKGFVPKSKKLSMLSKMLQLS